MYSRLFVSENNADDLVSHKFIFGIIFSRCRDISATVRAKSLQTLAEVTAANNDTVNIVIKDLLSMNENENRNEENANNNELVTVDFAEILQDPEANIDDIDPLPSTAVFIDFLRRRALDESVFVRKNALSLLENILKVSYIGNESNSDIGNLIQILMEHCRDSSLMVRKQMVGSLTELLRTYPDNETVIRHWVEGVFPLILDVEHKAAEKVLEVQ